jgi:hypothetical protein
MRPSVVPQYCKKKKKKSAFGGGGVAHMIMTIILATWEAEIWEDASWRRVYQTPSHPIKKWVWWHTPVIPATQDI